MNAVAQISFETAYRQLMPAEKAFVDGYVAALEKAADQAKEGIREALQRPIPAEVFEASGGMLRRPMVIAAIVELVNEIASATELNIRRVFKHVNAIAFSSIADYWTLGQDGKPFFDFSKATPEQLLALKSVDYEENARTGMRKIKVTLHDKPTALYKYLEMFGVTQPDNAYMRQIAANTARHNPAANGNAVQRGGLAESYALMLTNGALA